jgi:predicted GNAT family acetyltransferase
MTDIRVADNPGSSRYEAYVGDEVAGFVQYTATTSTITLVHTEVDPSFEGQGVGSALARGLLDDLLERGDRRVKVVCPFIRAWLERHPDYQERLATSHAH